MSVDDKIRRAEEIYYRRREQERPQNEYQRYINNEKKQNKINIRLVKKMIIQIMMCLIIYSIFYVIVNNNYIFSEDFRNKAKEILNTDINFLEIYNFATEKINEIIKTMPSQQEKQQETQQENQQEIKQEEVNQENQQESQPEQITNEENIGGAEEVLQESNVEEEVQLSQMEIDANEIKNIVSFIKPLQGKITSEYGYRDPTTPTVPKNHTGVDIASPTGTKIVSATDGTVILSSDQGDYGKHLKIQYRDIIVVYAHCSKLYVKQGDQIQQGQEIAEVGSTGNSTGPHLHFEIRYQNRYVDPQLVIEL